MSLEVRILGCGSSGGVPRLGEGGPNWGACDPENPKNRRRRCSLLVRRGATTVLVDTSPDMREQLLAARVTHLDAVLMTHPHADQTNGIDDLRPLTFLMHRRVEMHADKATLAHLSGQFSYCFETPAGTEQHLAGAEIDAHVADVAVVRRALSHDHPGPVAPRFLRRRVLLDDDRIGVDHS